MKSHSKLSRTTLRVGSFLTGLLAIAAVLVHQGPRASSYQNNTRTVTVSVAASDPYGHPLSYQWRSTDGTIQNVNAPSTTWKLVNGPGLHFAYVLVSNGFGGYTERRVAVNTDSMSGGGENEYEPRSLRAPAAPAQQGDYFRSFVTWGTSSTEGTLGPFPASVYAPNVNVTLQDTSNSLPLYPLNGPATTNVEGQYIVPGFPSYGDTFNINCTLAFGGLFSNLLCGSDSFSYFFSPPPPLMAVTEYFPYEPTIPSTTPAVTGSLDLQDGSPCGTQNEFFGVHSTATATLTGGGSNLAGPVPVNALGYYALPVIAGATAVSLQCENNSAIQVAIASLDPVNGNDLGQTFVSYAAPPTVTSMSAVRNGKQVGLFLPPPSGFPSDPFNRSDQFLAFKGLDSRLGACQYYKAIGAIKGCDSNGNFNGAIRFDDWKRTVKIDNYATGSAPEYIATYVNKVDLNLTRNHKSISYGPNQTAAVVCNHLGPPGTTPAQLMNPAQSDIDTAVANTLSNKNLVACVAMDYSITPGVNNNQPFTRFLIFGPDGSLLPSINLDGRREKFVPGTCVVCHGGDHYAGKFPEDGSGFANIGAHFLPYDVGNFEFSSQAGLTKADQEQVIYLLNQNVLLAGPTPAEQTLIAGWYASGQVLDENYLPPSWVATSTNLNNNPYAADFYTKIIARSCRTCHVAFPQYDFNQSVNFFGNEEVCGLGPETVNAVDFLRYHTMPNSLITFNRFWLSGTAVDLSGDPSQVDLWNNFEGYFGGPANRCIPGNTP